MRIFEVKGHEVPLSQLPAGAKQTEWTTLLDEIKPSDFIKNFHNYKFRILANLVPRDLTHLRQLEYQISQNPQNAQLKANHKSILLQATSVEFVQIRELKIDAST